MGIGRILSGAFRRARAAEKRGELREAARGYLEAGEPALAAAALVGEAERSPSFEAKLTALLEARRVAPEDGLRRELDVRLGRLVLRDSTLRGALSAEERRRLAEAAERLEAAGEMRDAADAWQLLGRTQELLRCLEAAGDIERLEPLLDAEAEKSRAALKVRSLLADHRVHRASGERTKALALLREAARVAPDDASIRDMVREMEGRVLVGQVVRLRVADRDVVVVGKLPLVLGRGDADVAVRGASVSRRHAEIGVDGDQLLVRDLASRNGTLIGGVPVRGEVRLGGRVLVGLGDDSAVECQAGRASDGRPFVHVEVARGLDRGMRVLACAGRVPLPDTQAELAFENGPALVAVRPALLSLRVEDEELGVARVELLRGDVVRVGDKRVEVLG
ncbi:MAG: FHA domain-containing protein [Deltaproteobacteria bacterium]|nr:FHA domain-containing protein [Deltaproteobacteria bacterium]